MLRESPLPLSTIGIGTATLSPISPAFSVTRLCFTIRSAWLGCAFLARFLCTDISSCCISSGDWLWVGGGSGLNGPCTYTVTQCDVDGIEGDGSWQSPESWQSRPDVARTDISCSSSNVSDISSVGPTVDGRMTVIRRFRRDYWQFRKGRKLFVLRSLRNDRWLCWGFSCSFCWIRTDDKQIILWLLQDLCWDCQRQTHLRIGAKQGFVRRALYTRMISRILLILDKAKANRSVLCIVVWHPSRPI